MLPLRDLSRLALAAVLAAAMVGPAVSQDGRAGRPGSPPGPRGPEIGGVTLPLMASPSEQDIYDAWPIEARELGFEGEAVLTCTVTLERTLRDCKIKSEDHPNIGFGAAALSLIPKFRVVRAGLQGGAPTAVTLDLPVRFRCGVRCKPLDTSDLTGPLAVRVPWSGAPTTADVVAAYPAAARAARVGGAVVLQCKFRGDGGLRGCDKKSETPEGQGFAAAAMKLVPLFRAPPSPQAPLDGATVYVPFAFDVREGHDPGTATGTPQWRREPPSQAFIDAYPKAALQQGVTQGQTALECVLQPTGELGSCSVVSESPAGLGFGQAALGLRGQFAMTLWSPDGLPTAGAKIRAPVSFQLQERAPAGEHVAVVQSPEFDKTPTPLELSAAYPDRARLDRTTGQAVLSCRVQADSSLTGCAVVSEDPKGYQFGAAALSLAHSFREKPTLVDGKPFIPVGTSVQITITFRP